MMLGLGGQHKSLNCFISVEEGRKGALSWCCVWEGIPRCRAEGNDYLLKKIPRATKGSINGRGCDSRIQEPKKNLSRTSIHPSVHPSLHLHPPENARDKNPTPKIETLRSAPLPTRRSSPTTTYSQSSSLSSSLRASFGLLGAWLGLPELAPTTS